MSNLSVDQVDSKTDLSAFELIKEPHGLIEAADGWQRLEAFANSPTQHFIWSQAAAESFETADRLQIVLSGSPQNPTAIAPLVKGREDAARLEMLGLSELTEPEDFIHAGADALEDLAQTLAALKMAIMLERTPADSPLIGAIKEAYRSRGIVHTAPALGCPYIELDEGWRDPLQKFNAGRRSDFRRASRNAEKFGEVSFEICSPAPHEVAPLVEEAFRVEAGSWKGEEGSALAIDARRGGFYRRYALLAAQKGILKLCFLRVNGQAIAMQYAVECHGRFWLLKIGYDDQYSRCSPGNLLMLHTLGYAAEKGLLSYEFLGTAAPWTQVWTNALRECVLIRAYPASRSGITTFAVDASKSAFGKLKRLSSR